MLVSSSTLSELAAGTFTCTRQSRKLPKNRSLFLMSGPPSCRLTSDTKSTLFVSGLKPRPSSVLSTFCVSVCLPSQ